MWKPSPSPIIEQERLGDDNLSMLLPPPIYIHFSLRAWFACFLSVSMFLSQFFSGSMFCPPCIFSKTFYVMHAWICCSRKAAVQCCSLWNYRTIVFFLSDRYSKWSQQNGKTCGRINFLRTYWYHTSTFSLVGRNQIPIIRVCFMDCEKLKHKWYMNCLDEFRSRDYMHLLCI